jgi:nicotinamide-nucleotide amidase
VARREGERLDRRVMLPGDRTAIRERTTTVVMHLLRRLLGGSAGSAAGASARAGAGREV